MNKRELLRNVPIFSRLTDDDLALLVAHLGSETFGRGDTIVRQGSVGSVLYIIVSGQVRIFTLSEAGQELSITIFRSGDFFGELALLDGQPRSANAQTMRPTTTLTLDREAFLHTMYANPHIAAAMMAALAARLRHSTFYAGWLTSRSAPQRVMGQLLDLAVRYGVVDGGTIFIDLHLTQDDLASLSGTTRETVNRVLATLREQGLVRVERARVSVLNLNQLEQTLSRLREWQPI